MAEGCHERPAVRQITLMMMIADNDLLIPDYWMVIVVT